MRSSMWIEYAECVRTIRCFSTTQKATEGYVDNRPLQGKQDREVLSPSPSNSGSQEERNRKDFPANHSIDEIPSVQPRIIEQWRRCFTLAQRATREIDLRCIVGYLPTSVSSSVSSEPSLLAKKPSSPHSRHRRSKNRRNSRETAVSVPLPLQKEVRDVFQCGLKRQEMLYSSHTLTFAELHERCVRWTVLLVLWIHHRVVGCVQRAQICSKEELQNEEVELYLFFLFTAAPVLGKGTDWMGATSSMETLQGLLHYLRDIRYHRAAPKGIRGSPAEQRLHAALLECIDAAHQDTFQVSWNVLHPSSLPTAVMTRLRKNASAWLTQSEMEGELPLFSKLQHSNRRRTRNPKLESSLSLDWNLVVKRNLLSPQTGVLDSSDQPPFSFLSSLQFAWETNITEFERWNLSLNFMDYFQRTLKYFIFLVSNKISLQKIEHKYGIVPLFVGLHCVIEVYKELCLHTEHHLHEEFLALPFSQVSPDHLSSCLHDAVALCLERMVEEILQPYSLRSSADDRIMISNKKRISVDSSIFRLLVELVEPCACLLQGYAERLEPFVAASCPYWFRGVTQSTRAFWGMLGSAALRGCTLFQGSSTPDSSTMIKTSKMDYFLLFFYLRQRFLSAT